MAINSGFFPRHLESRLIKDGTYSSKYGITESDIQILCMTSLLNTSKYVSFNSSIQSFPCEVKMQVDSNCDADDDMMSASTPSSVDDLFGDFDLDSCLMNDGLPL